jgi:DNA-binding HxlR family transcriptional regulator
LAGDPLAGALEIVGGRLTLALIFELFEAPKSFNVLKAALSGIAANILSRRLRRLADAGVIEQIVVSGRAAYALTERGRDLAEVRDSILAWAACQSSEAHG